MEAVTLLQWTFDILLGLGLLWLAWQALTSPDLFKGIVLFIAFGLLMALAWVRLDAPDIALAEAGIGAGLTGALLLAAFAKLRTVKTNRDIAEHPEKGKLKNRSLQFWPAALLLVVAAGLGYAVLSLPPYATGLSSEVDANLNASGVSNPVTAVLLNFRGYDTMLEMFVLLLALLGVWSLEGSALTREALPGPVLNTLTRVLTPMLILVAAYLLWVGAHAPGGAFQAGSVLGAAGVLLLLSGWRLPSNLAAMPLRLTLVAGPAIFVAMVVLTMLIEGRLLEYPPEQAGILMLFLETAATLSIGVTLAALFLGGRPQNKNNKEHT
ncbi:MAG: sodium:proton antiporter [Nitrospinaceae bacterium]|nr:MAG: sodium:proton antiporter [Nitrospinaceae bacterium]